MYGVYASSLHARLTQILYRHAAGAPTAQVLDFVLYRMDVIHKILEDAPRTVPESSVQPTAEEVVQLRLTENDLEPLRCVCACAAEN